MCGSYSWFRIDRNLSTIRITLVLLPKCVALVHPFQTSQSYHMHNDTVLAHV
ncbi:hypothetical protein MtrunA17_Chr8g0336721 [Medicago truncatula]|uniref:Uncharacterized protein n=1 Tax=Medicago truncatula TaxID=3880 RepID=A0A396GJB1_MEDTR|nr:hypothetical protein MtrunA17_Chr8g0336721 [Medicago truncatula]